MTVTLVTFISFKAYTCCTIIKVGKNVTRQFPGLSKGVSYDLTILFKWGLGGGISELQTSVTTNWKGPRNTEVIYLLRAPVHICCVVSKQQRLVFSGLTLSPVTTFKMNSMTMEKSSKGSEIRHGITDVGVCPARCVQLAQFQYFITMSPLLPFGMAMYILCHCRLEICHVLYNFTRSYLEFQKRLWTSF